MPIETINPREDKEKTCEVDSPVFEEELLAEESEIVFKNMFVLS